MGQNRREFLRKTGAVCALAMAPRLWTSDEREPPVGRRRGMARGLTLLHIERQGEYRLAAKTIRGIVDVKEAAQLLRMPAPGTMDELLQNEDGPRFNALVEARLSLNT